MPFCQTEEIITWSSSQACFRGRALFPTYSLPVSTIACCVFRASTSKAILIGHLPLQLILKAEEVGYNNRWYSECFWIKNWTSWQIEIRPLVQTQRSTLPWWRHHYTINIPATDVHRVCINVYNGEGCQQAVNSIHATVTITCQVNIHIIG